MTFARPREPPLVPVAAAAPKIMPTSTTSTTTSSATTDGSNGHGHGVSISPSTSTSSPDPPAAARAPLDEVTDEAMRALLWGGEGSDDNNSSSTGGPYDSTSVAYIRTHAERAIARVRAEDPHRAFVPVRTKHSDVRLYALATARQETPLDRARCDFRGVTRVPGHVDTVLEMLAADDPREAYWVALNTQRGLLVNAQLAAERLTTPPTKALDQAPAGVAPAEDDDALTRVLDALDDAQEDAVDGPRPAFPRYSQRYMATRLTRQSSLAPVECCYAEYATLVDDDKDDDDNDDDADAETTKDHPPEEAERPEHEPEPERRTYHQPARRLRHHHRRPHPAAPRPRRGFLYRRSIDPRHVPMVAEVRDKLSKHQDRLERLYVADWLVEVAETDEPHVCKVVFTCSVYVTGPTTATRPWRHEFREFGTHLLANLRQVLTSQWKEHMADAGVTPSPRSLLSRPWAGARRRLGSSSSSASSASSGSSSAPSRCGVCSTTFSLLKKRHACGSCGLVVCSRCCTRRERGGSGSGSSLLVLSTAQRSSAPAGGAPPPSCEPASHRGSRPKECILCSQFGVGPTALAADASVGPLPRVSVSIRRHFTRSFGSARSLTAAMTASTTGAPSRRRLGSRDGDALLLTSDDDDGVGEDEDDNQSLDGNDAEVVLDDKLDGLFLDAEDNNNHNGDGELGAEGGGRGTSARSRKSSAASVKSNGTGSPLRRRTPLRVRAATEDNMLLGLGSTVSAPSYAELPPRAGTPSHGRQGRAKVRADSLNFTSSSGPPRRPGIVLLTDIETLSLEGSFHRLSTASSVGSGSGNARRERTSPPLHPRAAPTSSPPHYLEQFQQLQQQRHHRRSFRTTSEDSTTSLGAQSLDSVGEHDEEAENDDDDDVDDLANFQLELS